MIEIKYCCTHWGSENQLPSDFLNTVVQSGYSGIEINLSPGSISDAIFFDKLHDLRTNNNFSFIAQQVLAGANETAENYKNRMISRLSYLMELRPDFINSHTGKDHFSFVENCRIIEAAENLSAKTGVPILHETHRGRFSFHLSTLIPYLKLFPDLKLTGDFSHWCTVSESLLEDQAEQLQLTIPHIQHIHARIGSTQAPQVNNPFAPEWHFNLNLFTSWWQSILNYHAQRGQSVFTITPEFGPAPYMPEMPFSQEPLSNRWEINLQMKNYLQQELKV